ncbi:MAG: hypothetical protein AB8B94_08655 [Hyphomicrobiales bacterium]
MRLISGIMGLALAALIVWAIVVGDFSAAGDFLLQKPWGIVTLTDLYLGFILSAVVIYIVEPSKSVALIWLVPIFVLGNVVTAAWFALRGLPKLINAFRDN